MSFKGLLGGVAIAAGFLSGGTAFAIAGGLLKSVGFSLLSQELARKSQPGATNPGTSLTRQAGDALPLSFGVGTFATAGKQRYAGSWGEAGHTPNAFFVDVIALADLPVSGLADLWVNDQKVTIEATAHPDGRGYPVTEFRNNDGDARLWVRFYDGTQTAASPYLIAKFGNHPDRPWTSDMVGRGCPYVIVTANFDPDVMTSPPGILAVLSPTRFYDLRQDSTNGGSGAQRWDDQATWSPTRNPAVIAYNVIRGVSFEGEWIFGGQAMAAFRLPPSSWIAAANECDRAVPLSGGGSEPAYRVGGEVSVDRPALDVLRDLCLSANMRIVETGGTFKAIVGVPASATYSFADSDLLITSAQSFDPFPALDATYNTIEATHSEPAEKWATKSAPRRRSAPLVAADGDRELPVSIAYPYVPFANQVQRLMNAQLLEYRRFRTHQVTMPPDAWPLEPGDVVAWSSVRNGYASKLFTVTGVQKMRTCNITVSLREIDPSDYDWNSGKELPTAIGWVGRIDPPVQVITGWQAVGIAITDDQGRARRPGIRVICDGALEGVTHVRVQVRLLGGGVVFDSDAIPYDAPWSWILAGNFLAKTRYEVRGRFVSRMRATQAWSGWIGVETPDIRLGDLDAYLPGMVAEFEDSRKAADAWLVKGTRALMDEARRNAQGDTQLQAQGFADIQRIRRELALTRGSVSAGFQEAITLAIGPGSGLAQQLVGLRAEIADATADVTTLFSSKVLDVDGKVTAQADAITAVEAKTSAGTAAGLFRMTAESAPGGVSSRIAARVLATDAEGNGRPAAFYLESLPGNKSRFMVDADQFGVSSGSARAFPLIFENGVLYLDDVRARTANFADLSVSRLKIKDNAVSTTFSADTGSTDPVDRNGPTSWQTILTLSILVDEPSRLIYSASCRLLTDSGNITPGAFLRGRATRNGTTVLGSEGFIPGNAGQGDILFLRAISVGAGTQTIRIQAAADSGANNPRLVYPSIFGFLAYK